MRATGADGGQDADGGSEPGPGTELLPVPRAAFLRQVAPRGTVARVEAAEPEPGEAPPAADGDEHRRRPVGLLLAAGGAAAVIAGLVVTAGLLTGGSESADAGPGPARISTGPSGGGEADGGPVGGGDGGGGPVDGAGAQPDDRAGRDRGDGDAPPDGRRAAGEDHAGDLAPGRANGQIGSIAPTAPPADGTSHPPPSSSPTDDAPAVPVLPPVLGPGDSGAEVTELQQRLRQVGLGLLQPADGAYDEGVRTSVRTFQSVNGLEEDERGVYGPETRQELESRTDEP
ncbi:peptidoglycan-binding domain-containing protein [Streptomyces sp. CMB-StM0423]|uniref:peptidoglycan-binding domain-containing protein n=1 Tax=Streptomyces sp. CMB-StM0423 TaxID=2059884 RepID=UPI000C7112CA|nr:peptidoglycan-binding domain-containing protein [Streptomyces sp. CMB-StM0423]AUH39431.1 hypothetical protein CXR04_03430 [Streptomyces sp. CMB-StM0423]